MPNTPEDIGSLAFPESLQEMIGRSCLDCINKHRMLNLKPKDCMIENDGKHSCHYCGSIGPLVMELKVSGKIKSFGH